MILERKKLSKSEESGEMADTINNQRPDAPRQSSEVT